MKFILNALQLDSIGMNLFYHQVIYSTQHAKLFSHSYYVGRRKLLTFIDFQHATDLVDSYFSAFPLILLRPNNFIIKLFFALQHE